MPARTPARRRAAAAVLLAVALACLCAACGGGPSARPAADPADVATVRNVFVTWFTAVYRNRPLEACTPSGAFGGCAVPADELAYAMNPDHVAVTSVEVATVHVTGDRATVSTRDVSVDGRPLSAREQVTVLFTRRGALWSFAGLVSPTATRP